ncbi:MAG: AMIN domain-containing protein, partial [Cyanobacteria bacterium J06629_19]
MRLNRLLPSLSLVGALLIALPAEAARLQSWRFDPQENRLTFTTDDSIQPTAQLLSNPTRLVIDMPGTTLQAPEVLAVEGPIKAVSVSEREAATTRLVIEYNAGYTVDPNQVQVRGESARQWTVQLPDAIATNTPGQLAASEPTEEETAESAEEVDRTTEIARNTVRNRP